MDNELVVFYKDGFWYFRILGFTSEKYLSEELATKEALNECIKLIKSFLNEPAEKSDLSCNTLYGEK